MPESEASVLEDLETLRAVSEEAGALALTFFKRANLQTWEKSENHPVTEADIAVNTLIETRLREARPDYGMISEETERDVRTRDTARAWIVDPIDGTKAFMKGEPYWCIGLGLLEAGRPIAGVVFAPALGKTFSAGAGTGALLNGQPIRASERSDLAGAMMVTSPQMFEHPAWPKPWPELNFQTPKPNATLLRICSVACGEADASIALGRKSDWDIAPAEIIISEAGGLATTHLGEPFLFNRDELAQRSLLVSGKGLHSLLVGRLKHVRLPDPNWAVRRADKTPDQENDRMSETAGTKQLVHLVIGGELKDVSEVEFEDLSKIDFVGAFPDYDTAYNAWKNAAQRTVDNAEMRYFILHAHKLLDPETGDHHHV